MTIDLDVPEGTRLHLRAWEITPNRTGRDHEVRTVAVFRQAVGGKVWVRGHVCAGPDPDCGGAYCFEGQVAVSGIRDNLAGAR